MTALVVNVEWCGDVVVGCHIHVVNATESVVTVTIVMSLKRHVPKTNDDVVRIALGAVKCGTRTTGHPEKPRFCRSLSLTLRPVFSAMFLSLSQTTEQYF